MDKLWKEVGRETEAGKLLFNLYPPSKKIDYPSVKTKSRSVLRQEEEEKKRGGKKIMPWPQKAKIEYPAPQAPKSKQIEFIVL